MGKGEWDTLDAIYPKCIDHVLCQAEGDKFRLLKSEAFIKETVEVDVEGPAIAFFEENILTMSISESVSNLVFAGSKQLDN